MSRKPHGRTSTGFLRMLPAVAEARSSMTALQYVMYTSGFVDDVVFLSGESVTVEDRTYTAQRQRSTILSHIVDCAPGAKSACYDLVLYIERIQRVWQ